MCAVFLKEGQIFFLKGSCPMMFELLLDVMDRFLNLRDTNAECAIALLPSKSFGNFRHSNHRIGAHTSTNHTVPYGTVLLVWRCPRHFVPGYDRTVPPGAVGLPIGSAIC